MSAPNQPAEDRSNFNVRSYNRQAWNHAVETGDEWTRPVSPEIIARARRGDWSVLLTESVPAPPAWFPDLAGLDLLCLASGGGQQGPVFAAAGARVTVFDNSPRQLAQDRLVAERDNLPLATVEGDMADLSCFADHSFDLVFHPVSNLFVPDVRVVWREVFRVLRPGGSLLAGFMNPAVYLFDLDAADRGEFILKNRLPYSDLTDLPAADLEQRLSAQLPLEFGHTLTDQIGGQLQAGFHLLDLYEDHHRTFPLARFTPTYIATRAIKPLTTNP